jgi:double-stranded uracil-DNA glycosylase
MRRSSLDRSKGRRTRRPAIPMSSGFAPISAPSARILILGSLPGTESLRRSQYYAKPHNSFWRIVGELFGFAHDLPYDERIGALLAHDVALWDVCAAARRSGSLDSAIDLSSVRTNDFASFYARHPAIALVCFNGAKAADLYKKRVLPSLGTRPLSLERLVLPSTSPAHAARSFLDKKAAWDVIRSRR